MTTKFEPHLPHPWNWSRSDYDPDEATDDGQGQGWQHIADSNGMLVTEFCMEHEYENAIKHRIDPEQIENSIFLMAHSPELLQAFKLACMIIDACDTFNVSSDHINDLAEFRRQLLGDRLYERGYNGKGETADNDK